MAHHDKEEEIRKGMAIRLGSLAVWVSILVLGPVRSPFKTIVTGDVLLWWKSRTS